MARVLVIGAYGLIGAACAGCLRRAGHDVVGLGRSRAMADRIDPDGDWIIADVTSLSADQWRKAVAGVDAVVNAAGALQDGGGTDLTALHVDAVARMVDALAGTGVPLIQISAVGVAEDADTEFFRTKARGDAIVQGMHGPYFILRPGLVIGAAAYGGSALLRAAAALPVVSPAIYPSSPVQTVALEDVATAVLACVEGDIPAGTVADLVEAAPRPFPSLVAQIRRWMGLPPARVQLPVPDGVLRMVGRTADALTPLGWRAPVRTTSLRVLAKGITGDPTPWAQAGGAPCRPLEETLRHLPATVQDRWFARLWLLMPICVATLALFWGLSGVIALVQLDPAAAVLTDRGYSAGFARANVVGWAVVDIALGLAILYRPWAKRACLGMAAVASAYLVGGTVLTPDIWADPLGPFTKILPAILLPLVTRAMLDSR